MADSTVTYKDIHGFPGYRVGNDGSIWSCRKHVSLGHGGGWKTVLSDTWKRLKACPDGCGYAQVQLFPGRVQRKVHLLVLEAFIGPRPHGMECRHLDGNRTNNRLENLAWGTHLANMQDATGHGSYHHGRCRGEKNPSSKLTEAEVLEIRAEHAAGASAYGIAQRRRMNKRTILLIVNRKTWKHL